MDKPKQGINPKPAGLQNGSRPLNKKREMMNGQMGWSLPRAQITKVPPTGSSVKDTQ